MNISKQLLSHSIVAVFFFGVLLFAQNASAVQPNEYGLKEGDMIRAAGSDDPDIYIINEHGYKRLFLNPEIFSFYEHLGGFAQVRNVTPETRDAFTTSGLLRNCESSDPAVYGVEVTGEDNGVLHHVSMSGADAVQEDPDFFKKTFCINEMEFHWYESAIGAPFLSLSQIPDYARIQMTPQQDLLHSEEEIEAASRYLLFILAKEIPDTSETHNIVLYAVANAPSSCETDHIGMLLEKEDNVVRISVQGIEDGPSEYSHLCSGELGALTVVPLGIGEGEDVLEFHGFGVVDTYDLTVGSFSQEENSYMLKIMPRETFFTWFDHVSSGSVLVLYGE